MQTHNFYPFVFASQMNMLVCLLETWYLTMIEFLKWIGNVMLRLVFGAIGIFAMNAIFQAVSMNIVVGINVETMVTLGLFGAPGFVLLYAITYCVNGA